jgi:hypothetical protein
MRRSDQSTRPLLVVLTLLLLGISVVTKAQNPPAAEKPTFTDELSGKYEGTAKGAAGAETRIALEVANDKGKVSGRLVNGQESAAITEGTFTERKLSLKLGEGKTASTLTAELQGDRLTGDWTVSSEKRALDLKKIAVVVSATLVATEASAPVSLTGEWDGLADAQGQGFPFQLILKVEGEKVTGESSSSLGQATISNGTFKDGKLAFQIDSPGGAIIMSAVIKDGGLVGEFDYAGQTQGRWVAKKRNP